MADKYDSLARTINVNALQMDETDLAVAYSLHSSGCNWTDIVAGSLANRHAHREILDGAGAVGVYCFNTQRSSHGSAPDCMRSQRQRQYATQAAGLCVGGEGQSYWTRGRRRAILKDSRVCAIVFPAMNPIAAAAAAGSASEVTMLFDVMTCVTAGRHHVITDDVPC